MTINKLQSDIDLNFQFQENKPMSGEQVDLQLSSGPDITYFLAVVVKEQKYFE